MRLRHIKLAGFKSFVDPTLINLPGQLVGVVGPNGCGKSNIMDAVRWVLGESKASELRGESMQDVIFNGSVQRKPVARASVELMFDNSDQRLAGQWGQYADISVRRILSRDGNSVYQINHQAVRRKDIHDIFMGTGLGPRAYAIIGQGMIARIIEARPDELRVFLEEAAGISKYKERRRDTEHRLQSTRENLDRVADILLELDGQLAKLREQSAVAQHYNQLKTAQDFAQQALWWLKQRDADLDRQRQADACQQTQLALDALGARLTQTQRQLETCRIDAQHAGDQLHAVQAKRYECNAVVGRIEAEIRFVREARERVDAQLRKLDAEDTQWSAARQQHTHALQAAHTQAQQAQAAQTAAEIELAERTAALPPIERANHEARQRLEIIRTELNTLERALELTGNQRRNDQRQQTQAAERRDRLLMERGTLDSSTVQEPVNTLEALTALQSKLASLAIEIVERDAQLTIDQRKAADARRLSQQEAATLSALTAKHNALDALQRAVQSNEAVRPWLKHHQMDQLPRLWQRLTVEPGWEKALEAVLRQRFTGVELANAEAFASVLSDLPAARISFYTTPEAATAASADLAHAATGLQAFSKLIKTQDSSLANLLAHWMGQVYVCESLQVALEQRAQLPPSACFVVPAGHVISVDALDLYADDSEQSGLLTRQQEIEHLAKQIRAQQLLTQTSQQQAETLERHEQTQRADLPALRKQQGEWQSQIHHLQLEHTKLEQKREHQNRRLVQIDTEVTVLDAELANLLMQLHNHDEHLTNSAEQIEQARGQVQQHTEVLQQRQQAVGHAREQLRTTERTHTEARFAVQTVTQTLSSAQSAIQTAESQLARNQIERDRLRIEQSAMEDAPAQAALQTALDSRAQAEIDVNEAHAAVEAAHQILREIDGLRLTFERELDPLRQQLTDYQLNEQAARLTHAQAAQFLTENNVDEAALAVALADRPASFQKPNWLSAEVQRLGQALNQLGPVNLAALDELQTAGERHGFLTAQQNDLQSAIDTLEDAIRKIDRETRALLQETFDAVNTHFGELFPSLFGGGEARLVMTGEEILDAGVQVLAQPPGKRNSTIHLLSGGEKALTAIALVFALFRLNPAPFCLLDEVDAPLDDANTERFCRMVQKMSEQTQFLFISHNKLAMEMANQLVGVTMQERGVSRIVAVDLEAAVALTEEAA